jgi:hypothetical protein
VNAAWRASIQGLRVSDPDRSLLAFADHRALHRATVSVAKPVVTLLRDCVPEAKGERASWADILTEYRRRRAFRGDPDYSSDEIRPVAPDICEKAGIPTEIYGNHIYCLDRRLIAAPKRLGPMTRKAR